MAQKKKITIEIQKKLLKSAMKSTGGGITATIRKGLELLAAEQAYKELQELRGKLKFSINLEELREDRS